MEPRRDVLERQGPLVAGRFTDKADQRQQRELLPDDRSSVNQRRLRRDGRGVELREGGELTHVARRAQLEETQARCRNGES